MKVSACLHSFFDIGVSVLRAIFFPLRGGDDLNTCRQTRLSGYCLCCNQKKLLDEM